MATELLYHTDPFCWEFDADIVAQQLLPNGRRGVMLAKTYFYPTGGGQEHDIGTLGEARVTDVVIDDAGDVMHIVDREVSGVVRGKIDGARRFAFMQHHSGQHLLSQAILDALNIESVSANINIDNPSTIDLDTAREIDLTPGEDLANRIVCEDRAIKTYVVDETQIHTVPLRRPPKVSGQIRVVEIDGFDYSACGGTHCPRTGMIGVIKVVRTERINKKLRVHFACGANALKYFQSVHNVATTVARQLDASPENVPDAVEKLNEAMRAAQKELVELRELKSSVEAKLLAARAETMDGIKLIVASFRNRSAQELRALAMHLQNELGIVALLATYDGAKISGVVACASNTRVSANDLIREWLREFAGRGGGDARVAQGGGAASEEQFITCLANVRNYVRTFQKL